MDKFNYDILRQKQRSTNTYNLNSYDIASVFKTLIKSKKEYEIVKEQEITKRMEIKKDLFKYLKTLDAKKELLSNIFEKEYNLRKNTVEHMFSIVEKALENGKDTVVCQALSSIENIVKESPLKGIEQVSNVFENEDEDLFI